LAVGVLRVAGDDAAAALVRGLLPGADDLRPETAVLPAHCEAVVIPATLGEPLPGAVEAFARAGGPVLGLGGGFLSLCAAGLLPGTVAAGEGGAGRAHVRVEGKPTPFTASIPAGRVLALGPGPFPFRFAGQVPSGCVVLRFCDEGGGVRAASDPTGSGLGIAGVCASAGNVVGVLPGIELLAEGAGRQLLEALVLHLSRPRAKPSRRPAASR
jgi:phosphoribosylformylglycinamidine (FGAM) synthase-like amidotransferase family enzyme